jgi:hypothetical protein
VKAAQIILNNPGESHAQLLMDEFGITESAKKPFIKGIGGLVG